MSEVPECGKPETMVMAVDIGKPLPSRDREGAGYAYPAPSRSRLGN